jgi:hypothetical protein
MRDLVRQLRDGITQLSSAIVSTAMITAEVLAVASPFALLERKLGYGADLPDAQRRQAR